MNNELVEYTLAAVYSIVAMSFFSLSFFDRTRRDLRRIDSLLTIDISKIKLIEAR